MDEEKLIGQVLSGDLAAYAPLVERYHIGLIIYCEHFTHERTSAEDLAQEAFIQAYNSLAKFNPQKGHFSTWLYAIARRKALTHLRTTKMTLSIDELPEIESITSPLSKAQKTEIRAAVESLEPPVYRSVIEAYYWRGKSYDDIANELDVPLNTVRTHLRRAKEKLKGVLA